MPPRHSPNSTFPPLEQDALFAHVKRRIGVSKYIDFLKVIREYHEKEKTPEGKKVKTLYLKYVSSVVCHYKKEELAMTNDGKSLKVALEKTDLKSEFLVNHLKTHLDDAKAEGTYFNSAVLNVGEIPPTYSGMTKQDSEVLNRDYILPTRIRSWDKRRNAQGKEILINDKNDQDLQIAENDLHGKQVRLKRFLKLQSRVQYTVQQAQSTKSGSRETKHVVNLEFPAVEVATFAEMLRKDKRGLEKQSKAEARKMLESLRETPVQNGTKILKQLSSHRELLCQDEREAKLGYRKTMQQGYYNSILRNTETIKFLQYPSLNFDSLLNEILFIEAGKDPARTSFLGRDDDVGRNISYEEGLMMQFEATRWHTDAFSVISKTCNVAQLQPKIEQFQRVMKSFFDLIVKEESSSRGHAGDFTGVVLYGDEQLYVTIRLYHALLTRLQTAFLLARDAVADTEFRNNANATGMNGRKVNEWDGYLSDSGAEAGGWKSMPLPSVEGTAEDKMKAFLKALNRKASGNRKGEYTPQNFERDVTTAVGPQGNQLFTIPRILHRLRDTFREMQFEQLDIFESYVEKVKGGNCDAAADYHLEVSGKGYDWLFKLQCIYADSYQNDPWGSVGEKGDIGRVQATVVKRGTAPEKKSLKRSTTTGPIAKSRKKRRKAFS